MASVSLMSRSSISGESSSIAFTFSGMHEDIATAFACKSFGDAMGAVVMLRRTSQALHAAAENEKAAEADSFLREVAAIAIQCVWRRCAARAYVNQLKAERKKKFHLGAARELDEMRLVVVQNAVRRHQAMQLLEEKKLSRQSSGNIPTLGPQEHGELAQNTAATWIQSQVRRRIIEKEVEQLRTPTPRGSRRGSSRNTPDLHSPSPKKDPYQSADRPSSSGRPPVAPAPTSVRPRPTQNRKGAPMPLTGYALGALFWDASRILLDPRRPPSAQLWGLRLLHSTCMQKKKDSAAQLAKRAASSNKLLVTPQPPAATIWFPDLPFTLWVQGPLVPVAAAEVVEPSAGAALPPGVPPTKPHWAQRPYPDERLRSALNLKPSGGSPRKHNLFSQTTGGRGVVLPSIANPPSFSLSRTPR